MQPYFFPYIGYFQLMHAVDTFVLLDDVQYVKNGWINRNLIALEDKALWLTLPVRSGHLASRINERRYLLDEGIPLLWRKLYAAYRKPRWGEAAVALLHAALDFPEPDVAQFNANLLTHVARTLGIRCVIRKASEIGNPSGLSGVRRVIDLCQRMGAKRYINAIGGTSLYRAADFAANGIELNFLRTSVAPEPLSSGPQFLSVIHQLLRSGPESLVAQLDSYELVPPLEPRA